MSGSGWRAGVWRPGLGSLEAAWRRGVTLPDATSHKGRKGGLGADRGQPWVSQVLVGKPTRLREPLLRPSEEEENVRAWRWRAGTPRRERAYGPDAEEQSQTAKELRPQGCCALPK